MSSPPVAGADGSGSSGPESSDPLSRWFIWPFGTRDDGKSISAQSDFSAQASTEQTVSGSGEHAAKGGGGGGGGCPVRGGGGANPSPSKTVMARMRRFLRRWKRQRRTPKSPGQIRECPCRRFEQFLPFLAGALATIPMLSPPQGGRNLRGVLLRTNQTVRPAGCTHLSSNCTTPCGERAGTSKTNQPCRTCCVSTTL